MSLIGNYAFDNLPSHRKKICAEAIIYSAAKISNVNINVVKTRVNNVYIAFCTGLGHWMKQATYFPWKRLVDDGTHDGTSDFGSLPAV